mmetsp:Transcript_30501/g.91068  ORF Transcript_30501/g.91068 Transcript_30501/m.91068 type:complete len:165 (-) Transcript_30501:1329-1823(-)
MEKLEAGIHVARSAADVRGIVREEEGGDGRAVMAVTDFSMNQIVRHHTTGMNQLVDLNLVKMMTRDRETGEPCPLPDAPDAGLVRSPEEYRHSRLMSERIDLWALGNVLHYILAGGYPFSTPRHAEEARPEGNHPTVQEGRSSPRRSPSLRGGTIPSNWRCFDW